MIAHHWGATASQIGTGETLQVTGATKADVDLQLHGRAFGAEHGTVRYYRFDAKGADQ